MAKKLAWDGGVITHGSIMLLHSRYIYNTTVNIASLTAVKLEAGKCQAVAALPGSAVSWDETSLDS